MKKFFFAKTLIFYLLFISSVLTAQSSYFEEGIILYEEKKFDESKILFERDIVFNPKSEKSYLYLAKIFEEVNNEEEEEINLKTVLLLNPKNDEAIYMLILLKIKQSDYNQTKELIDQFSLICKSFCLKENEIQEKFRKLIPENAKADN
tara:strand:- start:42 stop:488 length:447 start_codon:yes stop_codon:yes gene_type:complete